MIDDGKFKAERGMCMGIFWLTSNHKKQRGILGYKNEQLGIMLGSDRKFDNGLILGLAYTAIQSEIKFKSYYKGTNYEFNTNMVTIYGRYDFYSDVFINGQLKYG